MLVSWLGLYCCRSSKLFRASALGHKCRASPFSALGAHSDDQLAEVAPFQHADEGFGRLLQTVDDILAVADAAIGDAGTDLAQECGIVLGGKFVVDEAA